MLPTSPSSVLIPKAVGGEGCWWWGQREHGPSLLWHALADLSASPGTYFRLLILVLLPSSAKYHPFHLIPGPPFSSSGLASAHKQSALCAAGAREPRFGRRETAHHKHSVLFCGPVSWTTPRVLEGGFFLSNLDLAAGAAAAGKRLKWAE